MESPTLDELTLLHNSVCQALSEPRRIQILYALNEQPRNVSEIAEHLGIPQPTVSRHLRVLRQRALVSAQRDGPAVIYALADDRIIAILETMRRVMREALERQTNVLT